jgi:beta-lactamase superfamily II metal-dependent hydrolase
VELRVFPADGAAGTAAGAADPAAAGGERREGSDASCVLRVAAAGGRGRALLVPAQLDRAEALALAAAPDAARLRADVVLSPRRGSLAPLAPPWVAAVAPRHLLVASRELGAPRRTRLALAWGVATARLRATAVEGALCLEVGRGPLPVRIERFVDQQPAWAWRAARGP